jgi:hypothetical protein
MLTPKVAGHGRRGEEELSASFPGWLIYVAIESPLQKRVRILLSFGHSRPCSRLSMSLIQQAAALESLPLSRPRG